MDRNLVNHENSEQRKREEEKKRKQDAYEMNLRKLSKSTSFRFSIALNIKTTKNEYSAFCCLLEFKSTEMCMEPFVNYVSSNNLMNTDCHVVNTVIFE